MTGLDGRLRNDHPNRLCEEARRADAAICEIAALALGGNR